MVQEGKAVVRSENDESQPRGTGPSCSQMTADHNQSSSDKGDIVVSESSAEDNDEVDEDDFSVDEEEYIFQFQDLSELIREHVKQAEKHQPDSTSSREEFDTYWRETFKSIGIVVTDQTNIPQQLFNPPRKSLEVNFTNYPELGHCCCDCDLPDYLPGFKMTAAEGEEGLTKGVFVQKLSEAMYGIDEMSGRTVGKVEDRLVIDYFIHMTQGPETLYGDLNVFVKGFITPVA